MLQPFNDQPRVLEQLYEELERRLPGKRLEEVRRFASLYYSGTALEEVRNKPLEDLGGTTLEVWQFLQTRSSAEPKIRVFNPDYEQSGWQTTHTVIEVLHDDVPFLVDSIRMEINRRELKIHCINNQLLQVVRDAQGKLTSCNGPEGEQDGARESLIYLEVDRHTDASQLADLKSTLLTILEEVRLVVGDFAAMCRHARALLSGFDHCPDSIDEQEVREARDFIEWLLHNHFTFLGYEEYVFKGRGNKRALVPKVGAQLGLLRFGDHRRGRLFSDLSSGELHRVLIPDLLTFSKSPTKSRVHRAAYPDYITIKCFNKAGNVSGECRFLGLYTAPAYFQSSLQIPVLRRKVESVLLQSGLHRGGHDWNELQQILEMYPRDDLFQTSLAELYEAAMGILQIHERRRIRLFIRKDLLGRRYSCLVYVPRDQYSTEFTDGVREILATELNAEFAEENTFFSESVLARVQYILHRDQPLPEELDVEAIERRIIRFTRSWDDDLNDALIEFLGEEQGIAAANSYRRGFPGSYRDDFSPRAAVADIQYLGQLSSRDSLRMSFYRALEKGDEGANLKLFHYGESLPLSEVIPILENLGLKVIEEHPYQVRRGNERLWVHDFGLVYKESRPLDLAEVRGVFQDAFARIWFKEAENDAFNRLVLSARLSWHQVALLRAYAAYMKQIGTAFSQGAIAATLCHHVELACDLVSLFQLRFDPEGKESEVEWRALSKQIIARIDQVDNLTEDRILRHYRNLILATLRTNYFQTHPGGGRKPYLALKLSPGKIPDMPLPHPLFEIFVYSPRIEGVHLRGGPVARGGLRWSDREEDYRTEVLGLMKAQQVKNSVIVPVGAKGGFVAKRLSEEMAGESRWQEGITCYQDFIRGLLDLTDNLLQGLIDRPVAVRCYDDDDPYLVVAADKGTASFSDIANQIALDYGFWLGDGFASGGSQGYDHKAMGITARGAWVCVERHFRELGINTRTTPFTVVGIGDMSGDVFGNGMLLSDQICLVAAFNHQHIFIDPNPDPAESFAERQRLFVMARSGWGDYAPELISPGGGVFSRKAKSIPLSAQMKARFNLEADRLTPNELISALLRAPVDLLWNGGIGTYVKSTTERHADVGDKANDAVRIDATELRCKVVGEGGNLGVTQLARSEFTLRGGACNTDFIDNSAGVDCSDHEVNIKILLDGMVAAGDLTVKQRNQMLVEMTEEVAGLVLQNSYRQAQAISIAHVQSVDRVAEFRRLIETLEERGVLNRQLEFLPSDDQLIERRMSGQGLTRAELSVLISYGKSELKQTLANTGIDQDPYLGREFFSAFPATLRRRCASELERHRLKREIVATQVANGLLNHMGVIYAHRMSKSTGAMPGQIARAYIIARDVFRLPHWWSAIEALDYRVDSQIQIRMMVSLQRLVRRASRWFLRNRSGDLDAAREVAQFEPGVTSLSDSLSEVACGLPRQLRKKKMKDYLQAGVPEQLASVVASADSLYFTLGIIEVAAKEEQPLEWVAKMFFILADALELFWFAGQLNALVVESPWQAQARESFREDLDWHQQALVACFLRSHKSGDAEPATLENWLQAHTGAVGRWRQIVAELKNVEHQDYAMLMVAIRELQDWARSVG